MKPGPLSTHPSFDLEDEEVLLARHRAHFSFQYTCGVGQGGRVEELGQRCFSDLISRQLSWSEDMCPVAAAADQPHWTLYWDVAGP